ncbi:penicillin-binding transpeptidase domain-containing protein [Miniphocaeibacter massiliensis]|uniref:penicillin-binding transpeptidase domain-containing protein n=1 Tax=Miniphocaeibacter massiliensis TaxID=2041841 RepID=UPI000C1C15C1|nr:penicillin-binding transpeptidase domain-containing protein [Miniphocaeibacter massiliensis]
MNRIRNRIQKLINKYRGYDRFYAVQIILFLMMFLLIIGLGYLTLVRGNYYRDVSENSRLREVEVIAPRGNIYDKNGKLLAGNKVVYTASIMKDDFSKLDQKTKNENLLKLSRLLEEDGANYNDGYSIALNLITFKSEKDFTKEDLSPINKTVEIIKDNELMLEIINKEYSKETKQGVYNFRVVDRVINSIKKKGLDIPLDSGYGNLEFTDTKNEFLQKNGYKEGQTPYQFLGNYVKNDESIIRNILNHPLGRELAYKVIEEKNLQDNLVIEKIGLEDKEKLLETKSSLSKTYSNITMKTSAKFDFTEIVRNSSIDDLLTNVTLKVNSEEPAIIPAEKAVKLLNKNNIDNNLEVTIDEKDKDNPQAIISYKKGYEDKNLTAKDKLKSLIIDNNLLEEFVTSDDIKFIAQSINTQKNITPRISVTEWGYSYEKNIDDLYKANKLNSKEDNVEDLYEAIKENTLNFGIDEEDIVEYSKYDTNNMLILYDRISKHGDLRYAPLDLTYNISKITFSKIEENFSDDSGIFVDSESIRYYPNGDLAAHAIGYMGKISTQAEIDKYISNKNYSKDSLVGKTGVEESQELSLKGTNGKKRVLIDNRGNTTETLSETKAIPGNDVYTSIDINIQDAAEKALKETISSLQGDGVYNSDWGNTTLSRSSSGNSYSKATSGAAVVLNAKTGEVIAMANEPDFNLNMFSTGISSSDWESLYPKNEKDLLAARPLLNISMQSAIQPGSTFKLASSLAGLKSGLSPNFTLKCQGFIDVGGRTFGCAIWNRSRSVHGNESIREAIRDSCNYYYFNLVQGLSSASRDGSSFQLKVDDISETAKSLGLGEKTGIDINMPAESLGTLPDRKVKLGTYKNLYVKYLQENAKYFLKDSDTSEEELNEKITEMSNWIDEPSISDSEIKKRLEELGFDPDRKKENEKDSFSYQVKYNFLDQSKWLQGDSLNVVIGQGQNAYTPIQMARYMATIANDGYKNKLSIVDRVVSSRDGEYIYKNSPSPERLNLDDYDYLRIIREGTKMAAETGSQAKIYGKLPFKLGVKTGTAEVGTKNPVTGEEYDEYGWTIGFAPYDNPEYVVVAVVTQAGTSSNITPMFRDIMAAAMEVTPSGNSEDGQVEANAD